jgi:hypothetical protein
LSPLKYLHIALTTGPRAIELRAALASFPT